MRQPGQIRLPKWDNQRQSDLSSMSDAHTPAFALQHTLLIPAQVATLTYTQNGMLILGSGELSRSSTGCTAYLRKMTGVFDSIAHLTLLSSELFEVSTPRSHR
jgi:hypothetical protein